MLFSLIYLPLLVLRFSAFACSYALSALFLLDLFPLSFFGEDVGLLLVAFIYENLFWNGNFFYCFIPLGVTVIICFRFDFIYFSYLCPFTSGRNGFCLSFTVRLQLSS